MPDALHKHALNTARSKVLVELYPEAQLLSIDAGTDHVAINTEIIKGAIHLEIRKDEKLIFSGPLNKLADNEELTRAIEGARKYVQVSSEAIADPQVEADRNALLHFLSR